jgi:dethiobiotin synthetase
LSKISKMINDVQQIIVAGIGTEVGKTIASAILVEALEADYWKPVQSGNLEDSDSDIVKDLISNTKTKIHKEAYRLRAAMSPHASAELEGTYIDPQKIIPPQTSNKLIIELAGGVMVPLNQDYLNIHLIQQLKSPVVLVSHYYLGSINHTLLSFEVLKKHHIPILGIIMNGSENPSSKHIILKYTGLRLLGEIKQEMFITQATIQKYAQQFRYALI